MLRGGDKDYMLRFVNVCNPPYVVSKNNFTEENYEALATLITTFIEALDRAEFQAVSKLNFYGSECLFHVMYFILTLYLLNVSLLKYCAGRLDNFWDGEGSGWRRVRGGSL